MKSQTPRRIGTLISALVVAVHLVNALVAAWMGYLSPDSWVYLQLAKSLYGNGYPTLDDSSYFAVFPFGYPLLLALVSPGLDLAQRAVMAKLANASLWISAYFVLKRLRISPVLAAALVTTPFSLWIAAMTWSENLMLLALILTLAGIDRLQEGERSHSQAASIFFLLGALLLGVASRYVFGFVILGFAVAYLVSFSKMLRPSAVLAFALSAAFFALYLLVNLHLTGYSTGMNRNATWENTGYLVFTFLQANYQLFFSMLLPVAVISFLTVRHWRLNPMAIMTALTGAAYLATIAYLRWHKFFDPFDERLLGPGWFLFTLALVLASRTHGPESRPLLGFTGLLCMSLLASYWVHGGTARALLNSGDAWTSPTEALRHYAQAFRKKDEMTAVISLRVPSPRVSIAAERKLYYGDLNVLIPLSAPYQRRETLEAFQERVLATTDLDHCAIDFSHVASEEQLSDIIDARYLADFKKFDRRFDSALADRMHQIFRAGAFVPCSKLLEEKSSR